MILPKIDECPIEPQFETLIHVLALIRRLALATFFHVEGVRLDRLESRIFS